MQMLLKSFFITLYLDGTLVPRDMTLGTACMDGHIRNDRSENEKAITYVV